MPTQHFTGTIYGEGTYLGERFTSGRSIQDTWDIFNVSSDNRSVWGVADDGWVQYLSSFGTYAGRYQPSDLDLEDTFFEVDINPAGTGNYEVGFFFRFQSRLQTYYFLTYNGGWRNWNGNNIRLYKVSGGVNYLVREYACPTFTNNTIYKFRCEMDENHYKIYLDDFDTPIIEYTDTASNAATRGSFGPWVAGQTFAKWRGFRTINNQPFSVTREFTNESVTIEHNTPETSRLLHPDPVGILLDDAFQEFIQGVNYVSHTWTNFIASVDNSKVYLVFGQTSNNTTDNPEERVYVYQDFVPAPPMPPTDPVLEAIDANTIELTWDHPVEDDTENGFSILDENDNVIATVGADTLSYTETDLQENTTYYRKVRSYNEYGVSTSTYMVSVTTPRTIPIAPSDLQGTAMSDTEIHWEWVDNSFNEDQFELITWDAEGEVIVLATLNANTTSYTETGLEQETAYSRAIRAVNTAGSSISNVYTVTTPAERLDPPQEAPVNFYGVAVSQNTIYWYWEDNSHVETGFHVLDENDNIIATLPANSQMYLEDNLSPDRFYHRKVRAFNDWGNGPVTGLATAKTLKEGSDYSGRPAPTYNLRAEVLSQTNAKLTWDFEDNIDSPASGFHIYTKDGLLMTSLPATEREFTFTALQKDTTYRFYVVAYNEEGNGFPSNTVTFMTLADELPIPEPEQPTPEGEEHEAIQYDQETVSTGKIEAFQSGVGDHLDLFTDNLYPIMPNLERFNYTISIKGYYNDNLDTYHPSVPFRFRIITTGVQKYRVRLPDGSYEEESEDYYDATDWINTSVNGGDTDTGINELTYPVSKGMPFNVEDLEYRVEVQYPDGTPVPVQDQDTDLQWYLNYSDTSSTTNSSDYIHFSSNVSNEKAIQRTWESPIAQGGPLEVQEGKETHFTKYIRAAHLNYGWRDDIYGYKLVITSDNPNIQIVLESDIQDFTPEDSTLIEVKLKARIINETQTLWYPSIHSGYYYLNQQEHYLYVDNRVRPKDGDIDSTFIMQFPYEIVAYGQRHYKEQDLFFIDTEKSDFLQGQINNGLSFDKYAGSVTMADDVEQAGFISRMFTFGNAVDRWHTIEWDQDDKAIEDGASLKVEVVHCDELGNYDESDWVEQENGQLINYPLSTQEPVHRVRYRLTMQSAVKKENYDQIIHENTARLNQGYKENIEVADDKVQLVRPEINPEGLFITRPIEIGSQINSLGTATIEIDTPHGSEVTLFSSVGSSENDTSFYDRTKWTPLQKLDNSNEYRINSAFIDSEGEVYGTHLVIIAELKRGGIETESSLSIDAVSFDPTLASNIRVTDGNLSLINENQDGTYRSKAIYVGDIARFGDVITRVVQSYEDDDITIETITAQTEDDLMNLSQVSSQWREVIDGEVRSNPLPWFMYRLTLRSGKTNRRTIKFQDSTAEEWNSHANRTNVDIIVDNVDNYIQLDNARTQGSYQSEQFELGFQDHIHNIHIESPDLDSLGLSVSYKIDNVWKDAQEIELDENGVGVLPQAEATSLRYNLAMYPIVETKTIHTFYTEAMLRTNAFIDPNIQIDQNGSITLIDPSINAYYMSSTFNALDVIQYHALTVDEESPNNTSVVLEVAVSDNDQDWDTQTWIEIDPSIGDLSVVPRRQYLRFRITLIGDQDPDTNEYVSPVASNITLRYDGYTYSSPKVYSVSFEIDQYDKISPVLGSVEYGLIGMEYHSPSIHDIYIQSQLYEYKRIYPVLHQISFGGHIPEGHGVENYVIPMNGEIITDGVTRDITSRTVEEIVKEYLASQNIDNSDSLSFSDYLIEWDEVSYPVVLTTSTLGSEVVQARSTANVGDVLFESIKIYFDENNRGAILKPVPQSGAPITIRNASGKLLRQVHFRDANGEPTLTNLENLQTDETQFLFLEHRHIDPYSLEVYIDLNSDGEWTQVFNCEVSENRLKLPTRYTPGRNVRVLYRIKDSYFVNWNYAPEDDACLIRVHTPFDPADRETRRITVKYETAKDTAYYLAKEINLNPLKNSINSGFIYLTDQVYAPFKIEIDHNPNVLYKNKEDRVTIKARVVDKFGNPLVGRKLTFSANKGVIRVMNTNFTDHNGMVTAIYSTVGLQDPWATDAVITVTEDSTKISGETTIFFIEEKTVSKIAIVSEKNAVTQQDVVKLKVITMDSNNERLANRSVEFKIWKDTDLENPLVSTSGQTDINGEFVVFYQLNQSFLTEEDSYIFIEAETFDQNGQLITEQMLLNISTFKQNLEAPIITATLN